MASIIRSNRSRYMMFQLIFEPLDEFLRLRLLDCTVNCDQLDLFQEQIERVLPGRIEIATRFTARQDQCCMA